MTRAEALAKLKGETTESKLTDQEYAEAVEAALPSHARRKWRLKYFDFRDPQYCEHEAGQCGGMGMRPAVDAALKACAREAGAVYGVGNGQGWRRS